MKKCIFNCRPYLCLFALTDIKVKQELTYCYGDSNAPWRRKKVKEYSDCGSDDIAVAHANFATAVVSDQQANGITVDESYRPTTN